MINKIFYEQKVGLIWVICSTLLAIFILRGLSGYIQAVELAKIGNNLVARYQKRVFDHLMKLGLDFYNDTRSGHLAAQINQNVSGIRDLLNMTVSSIARDLISLVGLVGMMFYMDPVLSAAVFVIGPPLILAVAYISRRIRSVTRDLVHLNSHLLGAMQESIQGIAIVKAFTMEDQLRDKIGKLIDQAEGRSNKIARVSERTTPISEVLAGFAVAGVLAYGGYRAILEQQPPGAMFAFITALLLAYDPARLARLQVGLEKALVNARMIYEVLDIEPQQRDLPDAVELKPGPGEIRFDNLYFSYSEIAPVLHGVSFVAKAGETTAVVGASGAGKSTLINLVQRFYDLDKGHILFDGQDIEKVSKQSLRHAIAYVSQQPYLSRVPSRTISATAARTPPTSRSSRRRSSPMRMISSNSSRRAMTRRWAKTASRFPAGSASAFPSPAPSCATPPSSCSTRLPPRSTTNRKSASSRRSKASCRAAPPSS